MTRRLIALVVGGVLTVAAGYGRAACTVREDPSAIVCSNDYYTLTVTPRTGGAITSLIYRGQQLVAQVPGEGLLLDLFWEELEQREFTKAGYDYEILKRGPDEVLVHLWAKGTLGRKQWIEYHKTVAVRRDCSAVRVDYEIRNLPHSMTGLTFSPWSHNAFGPAGEKNEYYLPTSEGVRKVVSNPDQPRGNYWIRDAVRPWSGLITPAGAGLAGVCDFRYLKSLYNWFGPWVTAEWMYGPVLIPCGGSFKTTYWYVPFSGLGSISGASRDLVLSVVPQAGRVEVKFVADRELSGEYLVRMRRLPETRWQTVKSGPAVCAVDRVTTVTAPVSLSGDGTYVFQVLVTEAGKVIGEGESSCTQGTSSGVYRYEANEDKLFREETRYVAFKPGDKVVTPHVSWAKPYHDGRLKGLFLVASQELREVVELAQRMDLDYTTATIAFLPDSISWYRPTALFSRGFDEVAPLLDGRYDFILISGSYNPLHYARKRGDEVYWNYFPPAVQQAVLEKVAAGTGLVYLYPLKLSGKIQELYQAARPAAAEDFLSAGLPTLPGVAAGSVRTATHGKGRIVFLDYPGQCLTPALEGAAYRGAAGSNYYDYVYSLLVKACLWAAAREPAAAVRANFSHGELTVTMDNPGPAGRFSVRAVLLDRAGNEEGNWSRDIAVSPGPATVIFPVGRLPRGRHYANVYLMDTHGGIVTWTTRELEIEPAGRIEALTLEKTSYGRGESLRGKIGLSVPGDTPGKYTCEVAWYDRFGRRIREESLAAAGREYPFSFPLADSLSAYNEVVATLREDGRELDRRKELFLVPQRDWNDYTVIMWAETLLPDYLGYEATGRALKAMGVDSLYLHPHTTRPAIDLAVLQTGLSLSFVNLSRVYMEAADITEAEKTMVRQPCLSDPAYREKIKNSLRALTAKLAVFGPFVYSLGDEMSLTDYTKPVDICCSPFCLDLFRKHLAVEYGSLERLNAEWGTGFSSWSEVRPLNTKQALAGKDLNFSPWADHRSFMDGVFADFLGLCRDAVNEADPPGRLGECGTNRQAPYGGYDWYKRVRPWEMLLPYHRYGNQLEMQLSFTKIPVAGFTGYKAGEVEQSFFWWWGLLHGEKGTALFYAPLFLNPDLTPSVYGTAVETHLRDDIKRGIGKLFVGAARTDDRIAVHYSQPSVQAAYILKTVFGYDTLAEYYGNQDSMLRLLEDLGYQYRFVASPQIENGELVKGDYRMLVMPLSRAVSLREADQIRRFVEQGGIVIADCQTGLFDGHVKSYQTPVLDTLFGIRRTQIPPERAGMELTYGRQRVAVGCFDKIGTDLAPAGRLQPAAASLGTFSFTTGEGAVPAVLDVKVGRGRAVYLNFLTDYTNLRLVAAEEPARNLFRAIFTSLGIQPRIRVVSPETGQDLSYIENAWFEDGSHRYLGLIQDPSLVKGKDAANATMAEMAAGRRAARVELPAEAHLYDIRKQRYLGYGRQADAEIVPGVPLLLGLLPRKIDSLEVRTQRRRLTPGDAFECRVTVAPAGRYVVRLDCRAPDNRPVEYFSRNLETGPDGIVALSLPLALNEQPGRYTLTFREVISGRSGEVSFLVGTAGGDRP